MKKLSRLLSFISGAALVISTTASLTAGAETEKNIYLLRDHGDER